MDVLERGPDGAPDPSLGLVGRYLELDLEKVERVHAEHGDDACAEPREGMVLRRDKDVSAATPVFQVEEMRTMAAVGKKLGWCCDWDMRGPHRWLL